MRSFLLAFGKPRCGMIKGSSVLDMVPTYRIPLQFDRQDRTKEQKGHSMRNTTIGIVAHVDAGKTTLSESILYYTGALRKRGRVDHGDAFLDTDAMEKQRGITIYSKLARFEYRERPFTLLDTPGHADFSPEMERALGVLDAAVLVISAADILSVQGADPQVLVLWKLLRHYHVPTLIFINKIDQLLPKELTADGAEDKDSEGQNLPESAERQKLQKDLLELIAKDLGEGLVFFGKGQLSAENEEAVAVLDENLMERFLEGEHALQQDVQRLVMDGRLVPVYAGSALHDEGTAELLEGIARYVSAELVPERKNLPAGSGKTENSKEACCAEKGPGNESRNKEARGKVAAFGARVYKVTREDGTRLTWMKITDGCLHVRDSVTQSYQASVPAGVSDTGDEEEMSAVETLTAEEKVSELRLYSGERYQLVTEAMAGEIVAVAGLSHTSAGDGLGCQETDRKELLAPVMTSTVTALDRFGKPVDEFTLMKALKELEEQEPMLHVSREENGDLCVRIMGTIQIEILKNLLKERYDLRASFGSGTIVYKETIRRPVEGVGHFEPLRHYAEVHLLLEPGEPGSGIVIENRCIPGMLEKNWQNLILSQLSSGSFKGVLTGSGLTDVRISLLGGKANKKHTSGGDFRKAAFSAVRQGLMMAENILLEPVMNVTIELPSENVGRAMTDISQMHGSCQPAQFMENEAVLEGSVPASELGDYAAVVSGYTGGRGRLSVSWKGYEPCHNTRQVMEERRYDPDADRRNPTWSVFCSHGAGTIVPWDRVREFMHVDCEWSKLEKELEVGYLEQQSAFAGAGRGEANPAAALGIAAGAGTIRYRSDDYYTYQPGMGTELYDLDGPEEDGIPAGEAADTADHSVRRKRQDDYKERERAHTSEEEELKRIFEKTYGPVKTQLRHPDNVRSSSWVSGSGLVLPSQEGESGTAGARQENLNNDCGTSLSGSGEKGRAADKYKNKSKDKTNQQRQEFLLVDGYNIVFAWAELKDLAATDIKAARDRLLDILSDYAGYSGENVIVVFDAYRVPGGKGEVYRYHNLDVVFTKEAETADLYIEKTAHQLTKNHRVRVATGDFVEQVIIYGAGAVRLSPRGLLEEILYAGQELKSRYVTES